jgi:hypothetical protein
MALNKLGVPCLLTAAGVGKGSKAAKTRARPLSFRLIPHVTGRCAKCLRDGCEGATKGQVDAFTSAEAASFGRCSKSLFMVETP